MSPDSVQSANECISMLSTEQALTHGREQGIDDAISQVPCAMMGMA